jgi:hypothetical protein
MPTIKAVVVIPQGSTIGMRKLVYVVIPFGYVELLIQEIFSELNRFGTINACHTFNPSSAQLVKNYVTIGGLQKFIDHNGMLSGFLEPHNYPDISVMITGHVEIPTNCNPGDATLSLPISYHILSAIVEEILSELNQHATRAKQCTPNPTINQLTIHYLENGGLHNFVASLEKTNIQFRFTAPKEV